jgi:hypothetical protein
MTGPARNPGVRLVFSGPAEGIAVSTAGWAVSIGRRLDGTGNGLAAAYVGVPPARARPWRGAVSLWDYTMRTESQAPAPRTGPLLWRAG